MKNVRWNRQKRRVWDGEVLIASFNNMSVVVYPIGEVFDYAGKGFLRHIQSWTWYISYGNKWKIRNGTPRKKDRHRHRPNTIHSAISYKSANKAKRDAIQYANRMISGGVAQW